MPTVFRQLLVIAILAAAPGVASADPKADAKARIERAMIHHGNNRFAEALVDLEAAQQLDPQPDLLFAIAQVQVKLGKCGDAVPNYERFLATKPEPGPSAAAKEAISVCKTRLASEPTPPPEPEPKVEPITAPTTGAKEPPPVVAQQPTSDPVAAERPLDTRPGSRAWYKDPLGGALVGAGLISGVVSIVFYRSALATIDDAEAADTYDQAETLSADANSKRTIAAIAGVGGAILVTGGVIRYVLSRDTGERATVAITPTAHGGEITWSGRW